MSLALVVGARPNFVKIAPIARELERGGIDYTLIHTGQHYDHGLSRSFFEDLGLAEPDRNLGVGSGTRDYQITSAVRGLEGVFSEKRPELVVVVGDVNSTLAGAMCASGMGIPAAHVEAGMRSFDLSMPEEINRIRTDALCGLLFTSCDDAGENLAREGVGEERIFFVGNVMIDTLVAMMPEIERCAVLDALGLEPGGYAYVTLHRPGNVDDAEKLKEIAAALDFIGGTGLDVVFPVHPRTRKRLEESALSQRFAAVTNLRQLEPLGYIQSMAATRSARFVLTDSGGLQEETTWLGVPCLTLRPNTERPVTVRVGTNVLLDAGPSMIPAAVTRVLEGGGPRGRIPELWDGRTAARIVQTIKDYLAGRG
ncbi:MAG: UDP-N-acetylglucosamine 2-epimerase (non-hydrolyzing) [Actinobacteria bacterium]|nr:MAG: UDP-N-acetylglucosamine 2-epimerase (non-hydrolyzing) [Actinomycetota bacterium]